MSIREATPNDPLPSEYVPFRHDVMNSNGIHIIYPLGRGYSISHPGVLLLYEGFTVRVFGYYINQARGYEIAVGNGSAYALVKWNGSAPLALFQPAKGKLYQEQGNSSMYYGRHYSFAVCARYDSKYGASYQSIVSERVLGAVAFSWNGARHWESMQSGSCMHLSKHFYSAENSMFPTTGLDRFLEHCMFIEVGSLACFSGTYLGDRSVKLKNARGNVKDFGKPAKSGITIRISVRKTLDYFSFLPDYGTEPVVADYTELIDSGHMYVPRFTENFIINHVYMEVYA